MSGAADISKSLVGTWRVTNHSMVTLQTNDVSCPFGSFGTFLVATEGAPEVVPFLGGSLEFFRFRAEGARALRC